MLDLPIHLGVRDGSPIDLDVVFISESKELLFDELCAIVHDDGVWDSKTMDDVEEEQHGLLGLDRGEQQVGVASRRPLERSNQIKSPDHEWPRDMYRLECLGQ